MWKSCSLVLDAFGGKSSAQEVTIRISFWAACAVALLSALRPVSASVVDADVCVYGATSGGVAASVAAARLGKRVVLISLNNHVGGMTASGLGVTDIGPGNDTSYVSGISREFYKRVGQKYGSSGLVIWFEPHVAEQVFREMLSESGVVVCTNQHLATVSLSGKRITELRTEEGNLFRARMFLDTTYEGDLIAGAGVTFTVGREGTNTYGEALAGIRSLGGSYTYDPYIIPGVPGSGLLPFVQPGPAGRAGDGDSLLQAYNFRLCLTQNATNRIPITPPPGYAEADYELFRRYINARIASDGSVSLGQLIHIQTIIPNGKTDINANGELSTDLVGYSHTWATNSHAGREILRQQHEDYMRGLLWFYATSTNVPASLRAEAQSWGLAKDEFQDNGGWPWQIYVREARRMVGDYVMTQQNAEGRRTVSDPIALARYNIDSHGVERLAQGNAARWEGSIGGTPPYPYGISYRSLVPGVGQCENVFATFALSASHVAFASVRMEPVFMMTSQAAATAAAFAMDDQVSVQQVSYSKLSAQLRGDGQLLSWEAATYSTNGIILDEDEPGTASSTGWSFGANAGGWQGDYKLDGATGKGTRWVSYTPTLPTNGLYEVYLWWVESSNRATNTPVDIVHAAGTNRVLVNQTKSSGGWFKLMTTNFNAGSGSSVVIRNNNTAEGQYVVADGVRFLPVGNIAPVPIPVVELVASDAAAGEFGTNRGVFTFVRSGATNAAVTINYSISGSAINGVDYQTVAQSVTLRGGMVATNIQIVPIPDQFPEGPETVTLTLGPSTSYSRTTLTNATVVIQDRPLDGWRFTRFTTGELGDPLVSGDMADPDGDGLSNLLEYGLGLPPKEPTLQDRPRARIEAGRMLMTYTLAVDAPDVDVRLEFSENLVAWGDAQPWTELREQLEEPGRQRMTVALKQSLLDRGAAYLRIRVQRR